MIDNTLLNMSISFIGEIHLDSTHEILEKISKAAALIRTNGDANAFRNNFDQIKKLVSAIPGHEDLVEINDLQKIEQWQIEELQNTLLEQLNKTKLTMQALLKTGYDN